MSKVSSFKFRPHRGSLPDSLAETVELESMTALVEYLNKTSLWLVKLETLKVKQYCYDARIGWDTYLITDGIGVLGFTDGNPLLLEEK